VASHPRSFLAAKHSTLTEQIPKAHREYAKWTPQRIVAWVGQLAPNVRNAHSKNGQTILKI
jgi:hypothetical protein